MRLSNRNKAPYYNFLLTLINVIIVLGIFCIYFRKTRLAMFGGEEVLFLIIPFVCSYYLYLEEDKFLNMIVTEKLLISKIEILFRF